MREGMSQIPALPQPQLPLTRYNSDILLQWLERAVLVNCIARQVYHSEVDYGEHPFLSYGKAREAAYLGQRIFALLNCRGYDSSFLTEIIASIEEDVFA